MYSHYGAPEVSWIPTKITLIEAAIIIRLINFFKEPRKKTYFREVFALSCLFGSKILEFVCLLQESDQKKLNVQ